MFNNLGYQWASTLLAFLTLAMLPFPYVPFPEPFRGNIANLAQVHFLPVWKKLESEKQVRFRMSALAKMIQLVVGRSWEN